IAFLHGLPPGTVMLIAVGDEAGLNNDNSCTHLLFTWVGEIIQALEALGSMQISNYCYQDSWELIAVKGQPSQVRDEKWGHAAQVGHAPEVSGLTVLRRPR